MHEGYIVMFFSMAHVIEFAAIIVATVTLWFFLKGRAGKKTYILLALTIVWSGVFSGYLATQIISPKEHVKIIATGKKNPAATNNEISLLGYNANNKWHDLSHPIEGNWAWYPGAENADYYYAGWFPGAEGLQPENATDYIVIEIDPGINRSVVFLTNPWYGIVEVEFNGQTQELDTYGNGEVKAVFLPDSSAEFYQWAQMQQLPAALVVFAVMAALILSISCYLFSPKTLKKAKKHQFLFEELVKRDFTLKYKRTILGMVWSILSPLCTLLIMWTVFRDILGSNINHFAIYMFIGQVVYSFFNDATMQGMTSLLDNAGIFTKVNVPKYLFLLSKNISSLINFGLTFILLIVFVLLDGLTVDTTYIMLLYPIGCLILFNIGLGLILSALFVFFRDMQYLWGVVSQLIMWVSAIFYSVEDLEASLQNMFFFNPLYSFISYFRYIILDGAIPSVSTHLIILGYTILVLALGAFAYKKYNHEFLYYV